MYVYTVHIYTHILSIYVYVMEDITNTHIYIVTPAMIYLETYYI